MDVGLAFCPVFFQYFCPGFSGFEEDSGKNGFLRDMNEDFIVPEKVKYQRTWTKTEVAEVYNETVQYCKDTNKSIQQLDINDFIFIGIGKRQNPEQIMKKIKEVCVNGTLRPGKWSAEEDQMLVGLVDTENKWTQIAKVLNLQFHSNLTIRNSKSCKERWNNYLNPKIDKGKFTKDEDLKLLKGFIMFANKWKSIQSLLPNRTEGAIKNRCKSIVRRLQQEFKDEDLVKQKIRDLCNYKG
jgi:hypothetical protein